jgi:hypothetical protein
MIAGLRTVRLSRQFASSVSAISHTPSYRRLRIYAVDPSLALRIETAAINEITIRVPWEAGLKRGPVGEYLEVVDFDPASGVFYSPVDLNEPNLLAEDGLVPSEGNPNFHQQMVYAVAMATIGHFERALGRVALWATHGKSSKRHKFVRRLRIYPHALRDQNAYYDSQKKALLFGYFPVRAKDAQNTPGTIVFSCLSHDIVAHEVTHALLDGVHPRFVESTNPDVKAFHEAFADVVALFQHFSYPGMLRDQISRTRGDLDSENMLAQLAQQFGRATGHGGALRDALGTYDKTSRKWASRAPDPQVLEREMEPHARGAILVAAVFRAFLLAYRRNTKDLFRIASQGTGILPAGEIHPDLANRLAEEARRCAQQILQMCIRALDYCPPVDITFGDFLRAIISADVDLNPDDDYGFRVAIIESFRQWGIGPRRVRSMSSESLQWDTFDDARADEEGRETFFTMLGDMFEPLTSMFTHAVAELFNTPQESAGLDDEEEEEAEEDGGDDGAESAPPEGPLQFEPWTLESDRYTVWKTMQKNRVALWRWLMKQPKKNARAFGLVLDTIGVPPTVYRSKENVPSVEVHSVRTALRRSSRGTALTDLVVEITQRRRGYFNPRAQEEADKRTKPFDRSERGDFTYRAGCTILFDPQNKQVRRVIRTAGTIIDNKELERVRRFLTGEIVSTGNAFDSGCPPSLSSRRSATRREPFALLHREELD